MTLNEAIKHCLEVAKKAEVDANYINLFGETPDELGRTLASCIRCAEEHRQLAEWLKELKERRKMTNTVKVVYVSLKGVKMPKYLIDIPDRTVYGYDKDKKILIFQEKDFIEVSEVSNLIYLPNVVPYEESDRKAIEDEVWEFVRIITDMTEKQRIECFGGAYCDLDEYWTYQEAKAKYEAWKKSKKEIRVGDEVVYADDPNKEKAIVLRLYQPKQYKTLADILCEDGTVVKMIKVENLVWTGRHFPEVEELLKKMRESNEN